MYGLTFADVLIIVLYAFVLLGIGYWAMKRIQNQEDYFLGGRRFGKVLQTFASFGQATSSENAVGVTTTTVTNGASGIWSAMFLLFATPIYWLTSPWYRRMRVLTLGDFFEERYQSKGLAGMYAFVWAFGFMIMLSLGFNAMSKTIQALTPKPYAQYTAEEKREFERAELKQDLENENYHLLTETEQEKLNALRIENPKSVFSYISKSTLILIVCVIVLLYAAAGGLEAAFWTDLIQGILIILLSLLLIPFAFLKISALYGGSGFFDAFRIMHEKLPESFFEIFGSPSTIDFTWYYILALSLMVTINVASQPIQMTSIGSAKDEFTARAGYTSGIFLKRLCTLFWGVLGLAAIVLYAETVQDPDLIWGHATRDLLGPLNLGLVGLMIACLMAALMSTADCLMITSASLVTRNLYRPLFPAKSETHYVTVGRCMGIITVAGGAYMALSFDSLLHQLKLWWEFGVIFAAAFWLGVLWQRTSRRAAWWTVLVGLFVFFVLPVMIPVIRPDLRQHPVLLKKTNERILERQYRARQPDIEARQQEITYWHQLPDSIRLKQSRPEPLTLRQTFIKTYALPRKSIFWTQGIQINKNGSQTGKGMLNLMLLLYDMLGFGLSRNPFALNETIRVLTRTFIPFLLLIGVSLCHRENASERLLQFFAKMKTPARSDRRKDEEEVQKSLADPLRFRDHKLFPDSEWEIEKLSLTGGLGFTLSVLIAAAILGLFYGIIQTGS